MLLALLLSIDNAAFYILVRRLAPVLPPFSLGMVFRLEALALLVVYMAARRRLAQLSPSSLRPLLPWLVLLAGCNFLIDTGTVVGLHYTTALNGALLSRLDVLFAVVLGTTLFGERLTARDTLAIVLLLAGCIAVLRVPLHLRFSHARGDFLVIGAAALLASNAFILRIKLRALPQEVAAFYNVMFSTIPFVLLSAMEKRSHILTATDLVMLLALGVIVFGSYLLYYAVLWAMPVWKVRTLLLSVPLFALAGGVLMLRDPVSAGQLAGAATVMVGMALLSLPGRGKLGNPEAASGT